MIVGIQSGGIGNVDMSKTSGAADKAKSKDKASGTFADLMNLASTNPSTTTQTANVAATKSDVDAVKRADAAVSDTKKTTDLNKYDRQDAKNVSAKANVRKTDQKEIPQETDGTELKAELLSNKLKKLLNVDDETLQNLLQTAGISMQDLLDPAVMQDFILQVNDATSVDLLIDESLNTLMQQAMQLLDEVLTGAGEALNPAELPVDEALPEDTVSGLTETKEPAADTENTQTVEVKTKTVTQTTSEDGVTQAKSADAQTADTRVQVTVQTEDAGDSDASADMMKQNAEDVISNLNQALTQVTAGDVMTESYDTTVSQADIVRQVVDEIKLNLSKDVTSMTLQLNPEQLGKVQIHVTTKNGVMQAQIIAETEAAKNAVESGLSLLKEAFDNQDLKVDAIEVMVGTQDYFANGEAGEAQARADAEAGRENRRNGAPGINLQDDSDDEISEDQKLESEMMRAQGNQVSYMV